jgi:hypothetical protein
LQEFPPATVRLLGLTLPAAGGGYLRLLPFAYTAWAIRRMEAVEGQQVVVYMHPWEIDPEQPRIAGRVRSRFRHYTNLHSMERKVRQLLQLRRFQSFQQLLAGGSYSCVGVDSRQAPQKLSSTTAAVAAQARVSQ